MRRYVIGQALVKVQDYNEASPRVTACDMVAYQPEWDRIRHLVRSHMSKGIMLALAISLAVQGAHPELHGQPLVIGAITSAVANSFKTELGTGTHNFTNGTGNTFKTALYTSSATLGSATTAYSATNEISGTGYSAGGVTVTSSTPVLSGSTAIFDFTDAQWTSSTFTANGCLTYNSSAANRAVFVIAFGSDQTVTAGTFTIQWPVPDASNAILRLA